MPITKKDRTTLALMFSNEVWSRWNRVDERYSRVASRYEADAFLRESLNDFWEEVQEVDPDVMKMRTR